MSHFWAVGVGPGDPELMTVRAVQAIARAQVLYHAGPAEREGRAWEIMRGLVRPEQEVRCVLSESMGAASAAPDWRSPYRAGVERIATDCGRGLTVAFLTEGDPTLYSTAAYVWQLLAELHPEIPITIVPGVSSITAAAARVQWPLAQKEDTLRIIPAAHHADQLSSLLGEDPCCCLLKVGSVLPQVREAIGKQAPSMEATYVENLGTEREWVTHDLAQAIGRERYFSLVLLRRREEREGGSGPGKVWVIGLGPGDLDLLTRRALRLLHSATDLVGYTGYLDLLKSLHLRARVHPLPLGEEIERAALCLNLAQQGRKVALVSSGDAGVYGMASLLLEKAGSSPSVAIEIVPGVTAATAAASLLGAPLGHDFACISLSDLLTPWSVIERRLDSAGRGDFVIALYNPASRQRQWQLPRARDLLLAHRPAQTPVGLVHGAYRPGTRIFHTTLEALTAEAVTMETTVIVGSSQTRMLGNRLVTPRGYRDRTPLSGGREPPEYVTREEPPRTQGAHAPRSEDPGARILAESFAIIERELGPHALPSWAFAVVRRMIHASADFDFARTLRYSPDFEAAFRHALEQRQPLLTDTEMVLQGMRSMADRHGGLTLVCPLNDVQTMPLAQREGLTRSAAAMRVAADRHERPILVIGNAPTALEEVLRLVQEQAWRPSALIGMPVGFVRVEESKRRLLDQTSIPYLTCVGRKGGSAVAAAAVNALLEILRA